MGAGERLEAFFPRAAWYRHPAAAAVREGAAAGPDALLPPERLLQCVWYDPALRPAQLATSENESVTVEDAGVWNLEAGPDFLGAALTLGPERRRIGGDVEIHVRPADWTRHRHRDDPRYARVRVHVTYLPGPPGGEELPPGAIRLALRDALAAQPGFSFDDIDPTAYPYAVRAGDTPCAALLRSWTPDERIRLLEAAGEERLRRKAARLARAAAERGVEQVFYEEYLCALGYKHNKLPFRRLAERVPAATLRAEAGGDAERAAGLLLGVAGLLPEAAPPPGDAAANRRFRRWWDAWWKLRQRWERAALARGDWRLSGLRPANHPLRRVLAAAWFFTRPEPPFGQLAALARRHPAGFAEDAERFLGVRPEPRRPALVGASRARSILINAVVPLLAAAGEAGAFEAGLAAALPLEESSGLVRGMAHTLFGPDHPPSLYRTGLRRQGLLQIFHDFCLNDRTRCAACPLPGLLREYRAGGA